MEKLKQAEKYLSEDELITNIQNLSNADIIRLRKIASKYAYGGYRNNSEDLMQEAILKVLCNDRKTCPRDMNIISFLAGAMRSLCDNENKKAKNNVFYIEEMESAYESAEESTPESILQDKQRDEFENKQLELLFADDDEVYTLVMHLQEGHSKSKIMEDEQLTETKYNTIRRRLRRKIEKPNN